MIQLDQSSIVGRMKRLKILLSILIITWVNIYPQCNAQTINTEVSRLSVNKGSLSSALQNLQKEAKINIIYEARDVKDAQVEAVEFKNEKVSNILKTLIRKTDLTFEEKQGIIIIGPGKKPENVKSGKAQSFEVKGIVTDQITGTGMPGVNVIIKNSTIGTVTDVNGSYSLMIRDETETLVFSYLGYLNEEVVVGNQNVIDITLKQNTTVLQDVVIIGYGALKKEEITSSITSVSPKLFNKGVVANPDQLLQGKVAGLNITRSGDPNGNASVILRGASTLREGEAQQPFYVIDGVPGASINLVSPDDIVSIEVLKDASATAIYGNRAANGVIMVTTRKQKPAYGISYNGYVGIEQVSNKIEMLSGDELRAYLEKNSQALAPVDDDKVNTNWQKEVMRNTGISQNHSVAYGGGTEKSVFNASVNYFKREGILKNSDNERVIGRLNLEQKAINDKLKLGFNLTNSMLTQKIIPDLVLRNMLTYLPTVNVRNEDGTFKENLSRTQYYNPVALAEQNQETKKTNTLLANAQVHLQILKSLSYSLSLSYQNVNIQDGFYQDSNSPLPVANSSGTSITGIAAGGLAKRYTITNTKKLLENYVNYNPINTSAHDLKLLAGYSWQEDKINDGFQSTNSGFVSNALGYNNLSLGNSTTQVDYGSRDAFEVVPLRLISFYGRLNYGLLDKYFLQASIRRDGSSAFGKNNRWGNFSAVSLAWNIKREEFMNRLTIITKLKLRGGYGVTGNSLGFNPLTSIERYSSNGSFYNNGTYIKAIGLAGSNPNPDLKWEKTGMLNIGLDFGIAKDRISGTIEYYDKETSDLIWDYPIANSQGLQYSTLTTNVGKISNKGIELTLNATPISKGSFSWDVAATLAHNVNKVEQLSNEIYKLSNIYVGNPDGLGQSGLYTQIIKPGYPIGQFFTPHYVGRDENGISQFSTADGSTTTTPIVADYQYAQNAQPQLLYGLNNSFTWRSFDANFFLRGVYGNRIMNATLANLNLPGQATLTNIPRFTRDEPYGDTRSNWYSDRYIEKGSYLRLDNVTIGYTIPVKNEYVKRSRIYVTSQNLFTITQYKGIDPEVNLGGRTPGLDNNNFYPKTRTLVFGVNLDF